MRVARASTFVFVGLASLATYYFMKKLYNYQERSILGFLFYSYLLFGSLRFGLRHYSILNEIVM